jgi:hypothetical protein
MTRYTLLAAIALAGCATTPQATDPVISTLARLADTSIADLTTSKAVALAATPPDTNGAACADAAIGVARSMQKVAAAATGKTVGAFTVAEIASLYQPHSPQYEAAANALLTGCIAKIRTVKGATVATVGDVALVLPLAAAAAAL